MQVVYGFMQFFFLSVEDIKEKGKGIKRKLYFNENEGEIVEKRIRF